MVLFHLLEVLLVGFGFTGGGGGQFCGKLQIGYLPVGLKYSRSLFPSSDSHCFFSVSLLSPLGFSFSLTPNVAVRVREGPNVGQGW